jgi:hypothetical protein
MPATINLDNLRYSSCEPPVSFDLERTWQSKLQRSDHSRCDSSTPLRDRLLQRFYSEKYVEINKN